MKTRTILTLSVLAVAMLGLFAIGCAPKEEQPASEPSPVAVSNAPAAEPVAYKNDKGEIVCPVQGEVIASPEKAFAHQDYKGTRYYFCCAGCPESFAKEPEKYINKA